jgi:hypothetical protein
LHAAGALHAVRSDIGGLKRFLLRGNVVDLAVSAVIAPSANRGLPAVPFKEVAAAMWQARPRLALP